jgi:hypothetical protein
VVSNGQARVQLLQLDPELARGMAPRDLELARRHPVAPAVRLEKGMMPADLLSRADLELMAVKPRCPKTGRLSSA